MKRHYSLSFVTGMFGVVCYLAFALLAFSRYPLPYSPMSNWLSDLGNANLNPSGAFFYNIGIVATGGVVLLFFLGLSEWKMEKNLRPSIALQRRLPDEPDLHQWPPCQNLIGLATSG